MIKRKKNKKNYNTNQSSFYFEDYLETNRNNKFSQKKNVFQDRIFLLFFLFFSLIFIFSLKIIHVSLNKVELFENIDSKIADNATGDEYSKQLNEYLRFKQRLGWKPPINLLTLNKNN